MHGGRSAARRRRATSSSMRCATATAMACCPRTSTRRPARCGAIFPRPIRWPASSSPPCASRAAGRIGIGGDEGALYLFSQGEKDRSVAAYLFFLIMPCRRRTAGARGNVLGKTHPGLGDFEQRKALLRIGDLVRGLEAFQRLVPII